MARADEIRTNAQIALDAFKSNIDYRWLKAHVDAIDPKDRKRICLDNILGYAGGLEQAIQNDDLISMRRKENYQSYLECFARCRQDMENLLSQQGNEAQISLFSATTVSHSPLLHSPENINLPVSRDEYADSGCDFTENPLKFTQ